MPESAPERLHRLVARRRILRERPDNGRLDRVEPANGVRGKRERRVLGELAEHLRLLERERVRMRARQEEIEERGNRVLLAGRRGRRRRAVGTPRARELGLEEEVDPASENR